MKKVKYQPYEYVYALEQAAEFLEREEWPDPEYKEKQQAANRKAAEAIRKMADNYWKRNGHKQVKIDET